ncbi:MAG: hypothetical protein HOP08_05975 [Cyclobacteriaceae bacterium]|nr:hypothetical protein [Cyclobacteriaceae bacterium]
MHFVKISAIVLFALTSTGIFGQQSVPVFANRRDSAEYSLVVEAINKIFIDRQVNTEYEKSTKKFDSLIRVERGFRDKIIGYRIAYKPRKGFTSLDDLKNGKVKPDEVIQLSIMQSGVTTIPREIYSCSNLKALELINTSVKRLPPDLSRLKQLQSVYLYNNKLSRKLKLGKNPNIHRLVIQGVEAKSLPKSYKNFASLDSLELSRNIGMTAFPNISRNKNLVKLNLIENNLTLQDIKKGNSSLQDLNLQKNKITSVSAGISKFPNLKKLGLNYNKITEMHPAVGELTRLESIGLYQNQLDHIPTGIFKLKNLQIIDLYYNSLTKIDSQISKLSSLKVLYLSNNQLTELPESIGKLSNLKELYAHDNKLASLPQSLKSLRELRVLRVNNNYLTALPPSIFELSELENLDVSRNYMYNFPSQLDGLSKLQILGLIGNPWENTEDVNRVAENMRAKGLVCLY